MVVQQTVIMTRKHGDGARNRLAKANVKTPSIALRRIQKIWTMRRASKETQVGNV